MEIGQNVLKIVECINLGNASIQTKHLEAGIALDWTVEVNFVPPINAKVSDFDKNGPFSQPYERTITCNNSRRGLLLFSGLSRQ